MHRLVPDLILNRYAAGEQNGRFQATALFVDISGFSTITDRLMQHGQHGAEVLADVMRAVFDPLVESVYAHGGFITNLAGDAFTAVFPHGQQAENITHHALAAAWAMQQAMRATPTRATPYGAFDISAKVGLAEGEVAWGIVTAQNGQRAAYYFQGPAIDGCAAAEHLAQAGDIVLDAGVFSRVAAQIAAEPVADHQRVTAVTVTLPPPRPVALPPLDVERMSRFFPRELITQEISGEFRQVVNVFISLPTVRTTAQLTIFMQTVFALQDRYGGLLNRLDFGDKGANLLLFWGAPVAYENDIQRALNFMLDLQSRSVISTAAGITYRIAHAGCVGSPLREEYTCYGRGVNLAARFMTSAPRGEIWLDSGIASRAAQAFEIDAEGPMSFKGFTEKQPVHVLIERKEAAETFFTGQLVGRAAELARLQEFAAPLGDGRYAGIMVVWGEPGMGKSRLVHEFQTRYLDDHPTTLWIICQTDAILHAALNPFRYWLERYFSISEAQSETRNKRSFSRTIDSLIAATPHPELASELDRTRSFLGALLDLRWPDSLYEQVDAQGRYENTFIALQTLFQAESLQHPVVIQLEDAHWLDSDSQAFLPRLARALAEKTAVAPHPIAIILTARHEGTDWLQDSGLNYAQIDLGELPAGSLAELAALELDAPASPALLALLAERSGGNPFFAEQILRYLQEGDLLEANAEGQMRARRGVALRDAAVLPLDVRAVLVARLDRLTREVRDVVQTAAVLGREFELSLLSQVLRGLPHLLADVAEAENAAIWTAIGQIRYLFRHALLRDAAYSMQIHTRRVALHALVVAALETLHADDLPPHYGELGYHAEQANLGAKAAGYLTQAGHAARDAYQNSQAVDFYSRALVLTADDDLPGRFALLLERETVYHRLGEREAQQEDLVALVDVAARLGDTRRRYTVALRQSAFGLVMGRYAEAVTAVQQAITLAQTLQDTQAEAQAYHRWGRTLWQQGFYTEARPLLERALDLAEKAGSAADVANSFYDLGLIAVQQTDYDQAQVYLAQAQAAFRSLQDQMGEIRCLNMSGLIHYQQGLYVESLAQYGRSLELCHEIGWRYAEAHNLASLGNNHFDLGDYAQAAAYHARALQIAREVGNREGESISLDTLGLIAHYDGDLETAVARYEQALNVGRAINNQRTVGYALTHLGYTLTERGNHARAASVLQQGFDVRQALGDEAAVIDTRAGLARLALATNDLPTALAHVSAILDWVAAHGSAGLELPVQVYLICYETLETAVANEPTLRPQRDAVLRAGLDLLESRAERIHDARLREIFYANVPFNRALRLAAG